jgi:DNA-binding response OmpR family regulator
MSNIENELTKALGMEIKMRILVIEDNKDILANVVDFLAKEHKVDCAQDGLTGLHLAVTQEFDLIILDVMLPGMDGLQLTRRLRQDGNIFTPIIMLTARDTLDDRLKGFESGADDYLVKPFSLSELEARALAVHRRSKGLVRSKLIVHDLIFDRESLVVTRAGTVLKIPPLGLKLLECLMQNSPNIVKRSFLEEHFWSDFSTRGDNLRAHIYHLRIEIDKRFDVQLVHTIHGIGYRIGVEHE